MDHRAEDYLLSLDERQKEMAFLLREMIFIAAPEVTESFKWGIPFYSNPKALCYLSKRGKGIDLGFVCGKLLHDQWGVLVNRGTKQVRHVYIESMAEFQHEAIQHLLEQAVEINEKR